MTGFNQTRRLRMAMDVSGYYELATEFRRLLLSYTEDEKRCNLATLKFLLVVLPFVQLDLRFI